VEQWFRFLRGGCHHRFLRTDWDTAFSILGKWEKEGGERDRK
jgi:hypothetical protein